ncbi:MAG: type V CRISPR-associated protein Cas12a/Cpf1 [Lentisphaeria bacterium]|nr:type V CRISPR-associated protein Cas12a/Cpf1 [Lentisphaeria bacterium]
MATTNTLAAFTNQYSLSKTLRFELKPIGRTAEWIEKHDIIGVKDDELIGKDAEKAKHYKYAKRMLDAMHRVFIEDALGLVEDPEIAVKLEGEFVKLQIQDEPQIGKDLRNIFKSILDATANRWIEDYQREMPAFWRADIAEVEEKLSAEANNQQKKRYDSAVKAIQKKIASPDKVIKKRDISVMHSNEEALRLLEWKIRSGVVRLTFKELDQGESENLIPAETLCGFLRQFHKFSTYFTGFNENRQNIYDLTGDKATSIINRTINENLAFHFANLAKWKTLNNSLANQAETFAKKGFDPQSLLAEIEGKLGFSAEEFFSLKTFCQSMNQTGIDRYNEIVGGQASLEGGEKAKGINEFINLCRQQAGAKRQQFPPMQKLYKQILSKSDRTFIQEFSDDKDLLQAIEKFHTEYFATPNNKEKSIFVEFADMTQQLASDLSGEYDTLFLASDKVTFVSNLLTGHWKNLNDELFELLGETEFNKRKNKYFTFAELAQALVEGVKGERFTVAPEFAGDTLISIFLNRFGTMLKMAESAWVDLFNSGVLRLEKLDINRTKPGDKGFEQVALIKAFLDATIALAGWVRDWQANKEILKVDARNRVWYDHLDAFINIFQIISLYNMTRNHVSKKPGAVEKVKITFEKSTLLNGFVDSHTASDNATQYCGYLFRKLNKEFSEYEYFLGISLNPKLFRCHSQNEIPKEDRSEYERLEYYQPKSTTFFSGQYSKNKEALVECLRKALGKVKTKVSKALEEEKEIQAEFDKILKADNKGGITPSAIIERVNRGKFFQSVWADAAVNEFFAETIEEMKNNCDCFVNRNPQLRKIKNENYSGHEGFKKIVTDLQDVAASNKVFNYFFISQAEYDNSANNAEKPLYMFRIRNKDLDFCEKAGENKRNSQKRGKDNLHTMYFKALMSGKQSTFDLGKGELFFRKARSSKKKSFAHKQGDVLKHKAFSDVWGNLGSPVPEVLEWEELSRLKKQIEICENQVLFNGQVIGRKCEYELQKDRRFNEHRYFLHLSALLNYASKDISSRDFNNQVREFLKDNPDVNVIGIDRGEKHLLYHSVVNQAGEIIEQGSLNEIANGFKPQGETRERSIDYHAKLDAVEKKRDLARKSWSMIENIKELKAGYLSQVVHTLAEMIIKHNAIVVLEDLNVGFKRGRFGVEKQIYQKFEKALIDKLNYLVFKDCGDRDKAGHFLNAYQLTNKFESFQKMGKQSGILFYTTASYTSTTDPVTGFLKNIYVTYQSVEKSVAFWNSFDSIVYNANLDRFEFTYTLGRVISKNMNRETDEKENQLVKRAWTVCSCVTRSRYVKAEKQTEEQKQSTSSEQIGRKGRHETFELNLELKKLLSDNDIDFSSNSDIQAALAAKSEKSNASFQRSMIYYFNSILTLRVTDGTKDKGTSENDFILSPVEPFFDSRHANPAQPENGDANGAYNIARKGICILQKINAADDVSKVNPGVSKQEWQNFVQG